MNLNFRLAQMQACDMWVADGMPGVIDQLREHVCWLVGQADRNGIPWDRGVASDNTDWRVRRYRL